MVVPDYFSVRNVSLGLSSIATEFSSTSTVSPVLASLVDLQAVHPLECFSASYIYCDICRDRRTAPSYGTHLLKSNYLLLSDSYGLVVCSPGRRRNWPCFTNASDIFSVAEFRSVIDPIRNAGMCSFVLKKIAKPKTFM